MAPVVKVKASDSKIGTQREAQAHRVLDHFLSSLSECRLLCFFDDEDCQEFKLSLGEGNRGFHRPITNNTAFAGWPSYITDCIFVNDPSSFWHQRVFDQVIYLHGGTCADDVGMTMTFAHELQHVLQRVQVPELLSANGLFRHLPRYVIESVGLQWSDIPTEREARAIAKKIAVTLHGADAVARFLSQRADSASDPIELADVRFIEKLDPSVPYLLKDETFALFGRFKNYRNELDAVIDQFKLDPDFEPVTLDSFMPPLNTA